MIKYLRRDTDRPVLTVGLSENDIHQYRTQDAETRIPLDRGVFNLNLRGSLHILYSPTPTDFDTGGIIEGLDAERSRFLVRRLGADHFEVKIGLTESLLHDLRNAGMLYMSVDRLPIDSAVKFMVLLVYGRTDEDNMEQLRGIMRSNTTIEDRRNRH